MKKLIIIVAVLLLSIRSYGQRLTNEQKHEDMANRVLDLIDNLPEFKKADAWYARKTKGKHLIVVLANDKGNEDGHYYWVTVDEDHGAYDRTVYNFMIDNKTFKIEYMDTKSGKNIPLSVWRKRKDYLGLD
jgi:hypothetical protein